MAHSEGSGPEGSGRSPSDADDDFAATPQAPGADDSRLELGDDDVRLPWLEGSGDDDDDAGSGAGELIKFAVLGVLALAVLVGAIWWATRKAPDDAVVADGSTIEAPQGPYKEKPEDPEGKTFAGTGDTSFAVSEGQTRAARLGQEPAPNPAPATASPKPGFASIPAKGPDGDSAVAADAAGVGVQVGAYSSRKLAEEGWTKLTAQTDALSGVRHRVVEGTADIGTVYRLQAVAGDAAAARTLCSRLRASGVACQVKN